MNRKFIGFTFLCFAAIVLVMSCDLLVSLFHEPQELSVEIMMDKSEYDYDETIDVILNVLSEPGRILDITWKLDGEDLGITIDNPKALILKLTPASTKTYSLEVTVSDGVDVIKISHTFTVKQFSFVGTWKTTNVSNPAYFSKKDIVGIWKLDKFELYYFDANGGEILRTYSARGIMEFPTENTWVKLTEQDYYDQSTSTWKPWTTSDGIMWVKYIASADKLSVTVQLDMTTPADSAGYTWLFTKIDDTVDSWF